MKRQTTSRHPVLRVFRTAACCALGLFAYGAMVMPPVNVAMAATTSGGSNVAVSPAVKVDQTPLTVQPPIPPDITLMLDDSGSMNADYMPDYSSLASTTNDAMINASNNGVYYNPAVTYAPPPQFDGTPYPSQTNITSVPSNGFNSTPPPGITGPLVPVDLTQYDAKYECDNSQNCGLNSDGSPKGHIVFSKAIQSTTTTATYSADAASGSDCQAIYDSMGGTGPILFNNGQPTSGSGNCKFQYYISYHYFQYSTGPALAPVVHYVASTNKVGNGCGDLNTTTTPTCVLDTTAGDGTNGAPVGVTVGQNIANWFAYYHTRMLMAKSGLMTALNNLNPGYRLAFGSINGNNTDGLPSLRFAFNDYFSSGGIIGGKIDNAIAQAQVFDSNCFTSPSTCTPGAAATQRAAFWTWLAGETASGGTPLRSALNAVGQYYSTADVTTPTTPPTTGSNAWDWMSSDPGYATRGSAGNIACRQVYTILTTDGFWNGDYSSSTTTDGASNTAAPSVLDANGKAVATYSPTDPFQGGGVTGGSSLADVAMYYWNHDLQTLPNNVSPNAADPACWQHMVTFTMGLGVTPTGIAGTAPTSGSAPTTQDIFNWSNDGGGPNSKFAISGFSWPTPAPDSEYNIADLEHAGVNGHGGFFQASDPQSFVTGIEAALKRAGERVASGSSLGANSTRLATDTFVYQAQYFAGSWRGDLLAIGLNTATGAPNAKPTWSAAQQLTSAATPGNGSDRTYPNRKIMTYNPTATTYASQFVPFKNDTNGLPALASDQLANLGSNAADVVNYLRGDNTNEKSNGGTFRDRTTPLGDIVDSAPVYVGAPDATEFNGESFTGLTYTTDTSGNTYSPFYCFASGCTIGSTTVAGQSKRAGMIYVAGNDGMLHALDAKTGNELFAYLPGALLVNDTDPVTGQAEPLANLANPAYGSAAMPHQDYNDGQLTVADAYVALTQEGETTPSWHTILVGTTGKGPARSVYALDVTNPGADGSGIKPLWERYAGDTITGDDCGGSTNCSGYIGQMTGAPVIAQTADSTWSVLVGNGYNSPNGVASLLQFDLGTGKLHVHATNSTASNGLAPVYTWMSSSSSGVTDLAYAGDLGGRVWQFNLSTTSCTKGTCTFTATPASTGVKIFAATDSGGKAQPITSSVVVAMNPADSSLWMFFGTGEFLNQGDISGTSSLNVQTWYGLIVTPGANNAAPTNLTGRGVLAQRSIIYEDTGLSGGFPARAVTPLPSSPDIGSACLNVKGNSSSTCMQGWYMDLVSPVNDTAGVTPPLSVLPQGERMVVPNQLQGGLLVGTTIIPKPANQTFDPCQPMGAGWIMAIDPFTGTNPPKDFFDRNKNGAVGGGDGVVSGGKTVPAAGIGLNSLPNAPIFVGGHAIISLANGSLVNVSTRGGSGTYQRVSWRELVNP